MYYLSNSTHSLGPIHPCFCFRFSGLFAKVGRVVWSCAIFQQHVPQTGMMLCVDWIPKYCFLSPGRSIFIGGNFTFTQPSTLSVHLHNFALIWWYSIYNDSISFHHFLVSVEKIKFSFFTCTTLETFSPLEILHLVKARAGYTMSSRLLWIHQTISCTGELAG